MAKSAAAQLTRLLRDLQAERQLHVDAIEEIDQVLGGTGLSEGKPVRVRGTKHKGKRKRGRFIQVAEEFIASLLGGAKKLTGAQINEAWSKAGRGGKSDSTLGKLVKQKKLKRKKIKGGQGSHYSRP